MAYAAGTWLFLDQGTNRLSEQLNGSLRMPPHILETMRRGYCQRRDRLAALGIPYVALVAPEKQCVYPELWDGPTPSEDRVVRQVLRHLAPDGVRPLYPLEALRAAKARAEMYFREDTHWTFAGAHVAYREVMAEVGRHLSCRVVGEEEVTFYTGAPRHDLQRFDTLCPHDLANKIEPDYMGVPHRVMIAGRRARMVEDNRVVNIGHRAVFEQDAPHLPTCLLLRDSYADLMLPFLAESFRRLVAVWHPFFDWQLIEHERPDVVITQRAERFMVFLHKDDDPGYAERAAAKIAEGRLTPDPEPARPAW